MVCLKLWGESLKQKKVVMLCDNMATVEAINSGASRNVMVQGCLREIHKISGWHSFQLKMQYLQGCKDQVSDVLSRWSSHEKFEKLWT